MEMTRRRSLGERMKGAALLDAAVYEEIEGDPGAIRQAALVVGLVALATALAAAGAGLGAVVAAIVTAYAGWLVWALIVYVIGVKLLGGKADVGEILRTTGFAQTPGVLYILSFVPLLQVVVALAVPVWIVAAVVIAIRQALDVGTGKAILAAVLGFLVYIALAVGLAILLAPGAA